MSRLEAAEPQCEGQHTGGLDFVITPKAKDLGGFTVKRVLPSPEVRKVGPFVFFDVTVPP